MDSSLICYNNLTKKEEFMETLEDKNIEIYCHVDDFNKIFIIT